MKILVNKKYGGFDLNEEFIKEFSEQFPEIGEDELIAIRFGDFYRTNKKIIKAIEDFGIDKAGRFSYTDLRIITIPDECTDWTIEEREGYEQIIYVLDGKLNFA